MNRHKFEDLLDDYVEDCLDLETLDVSDPALEGMKAEIAEKKANLLAAFDGWRRAIIDIHAACEQKIDELTAKMISQRPSALIAAALQACTCQGMCEHCKDGLEDALAVYEEDI